jgi:hypothetical protein
MATVRFSTQLQDAIVKRAQGMFTAQVEAARASLPPDLGERLYDCFFSPDVAAKMRALPDYMLNTKEQLDFQGFHSAPEDVWQTSTVKQNTWGFTSVAVRFAVPQRWPYRFDEHVTGFKASSWGGGTADFTDPRYEWLKPIVKEYTERVFKAVVRRDTFVDGVQKVMQTYSTLAPALKAWPALWDLLPDETKDKHREVKERVKKEIDCSLVDLNSLTAAVTLSKITR